MIQRIKFFITLILIILIADIITSIFWQFLAQQDKSIPINTIQNTVVRNNLPQNLFGVEKKKVVVAPPKKKYEKTKKTSLDLKLIGVISRKINPIAIIELANRTSNFYTIGDKVQGFAEIKDIQGDFVIINYNGKDEKLLIERPVINFISNNNESSKPIEVNNSPTNTIKEFKISDNNKTKIKEYLQQARLNPASLLDVVDVEPVFEGDLLYGFKINPIKEREIFNEVGLQSGDIIVQINNTRLDNFKNAFAIGRDLATDQIFDFVVLRDGLEKNINFNLE